MLNYAGQGPGEITAVVWILICCVDNRWLIEYFHVQPAIAYLFYRGAMGNIFAIAVKI